MHCNLVKLYNVCLDPVAAPSSVTRQLGRCAKVLCVLYMDLSINFKPNLNSKLPPWPLSLSS